MEPVKEYKYPHHSYQGGGGGGGSSTLIKVQAL